MNIKYILFLILIVTLVNLFYKQWLLPSETSSLWQYSWTSNISNSTCPMYGFKCDSDESCDCEKMCGNGDYVPFRVMPNEPIYLMDQQLTEGTYCLPKGIGECNQKTSYHVFSSTGWKCIPRNKSTFQNPCYNEEAKDHHLNVLWDYLKNEPAEQVEFAYERLKDGTLRYRCKCDSMDIRGRPMVATIPFVCSVDYCIRDLPRPLPVTRFKDFKCECGPYLHATDDETSPCVMERTRIENEQFIGRVDCMTNFSWKKSPVFCPHDEGAISFTTPIKSVKSPLNYVQDVVLHQP